ncbi:MAG: Holliday junction resolvase RuvX [Aquificaceae bacterium]|nr:Holliday junction resolvase RuvX [Aquificaceae bacterium]MCS7277927.1 Holliday junction resolvase RuvX [Aquificaceae bacterium]MDW8066829.1 Holliday junction resolvase RuvX [Aquificaceae bacterium]MDW8424009.1 Holliday junction resolvase RuvX [Aquificaceae bacterium]
MKVLAIDYGTKRIGLAVGDTRLGVGVPLGSLLNKGEGTLLQIAEKVKEQSVSLVLLGLPLTPKGKEGQRAKEVRGFFQKLKEVLPEGVEVLLWDERYTTLEAYRMLEGQSEKKKKELKDSLSAYAILLEYLESL